MWESKGLHIFREEIYFILIQNLFILPHITHDFYPKMIFSSLILSLYLLKNTWNSFMEFFKSSHVADKFRHLFLSKLSSFFIQIFLIFQVETICIGFNAFHFF